MSVGVQFTHWLILGYSAALEEKELWMDTHAPELETLQFQKAPGVENVGVRMPTRSSSPSAMLVVEMNGSDVS